MIEESAAQHDDAEPAAVLRNWGLVGTVGCVVAGILPSFMTGGLSVQIGEELHFGNAALGLAVAAYFATAAVTSAWLGTLTERVGPGRALRIAGLASAACLLGIAVAARSFAVLVMLLMVGGVANAAAQPAANMVIAHTAAKSRQGFLLGLKQASVPMSTLAAGLAVPVVALTVGWRWAYAATGVLAIGAALLVPQTRRLPADAAKKPAKVLPDARLRALVLLTVGLACAAAATGSLGAFAVKGGVDAGLGEGTAGYLLALGSAGAVVVYLLAGARADRRPGRELHVTAAMLAVCAGALVALAIGKPVAFLLAVPVAFTIGWGWPGLFNLAVVRSSPSAPGAATGITQTGAYGGVVIGPPVFGALAEHWSFSAAFLAAAGCAAVAVVVVLAGHRALQQPNARPQMEIQPPSTATT